MNSRYIAKSIVENKDHYRRFVRALRVGITSMYYRDDKDLNEILKIYDQHIFTYVHCIHFFIMQELDKYLAVTTGTMYQNQLALIVLFFILDYERGMKRLGFTNTIDYPDEMVGKYIHLLFEEGFKRDFNGITEFECNLLQIIHQLNVDRLDSFDRLTLLKNPRISILFKKFPRNISPPLSYGHMDQASMEQISPVGMQAPSCELRSLALTGVCIPQYVGRAPANFVGMHMQEMAIIPTENKRLTIQNDLFRTENQELRRVLQLSLCDITSIQTQKLEILRDRETFRSTILQLHSENEYLKGKIAKMEQDRIMDTLTSPHILEKFDLSLLF